MNILSGRDKASIDLVEQCFHKPPVKDLISKAPLIDRQRNLSPEAFKTEFRDLGKPVIIEGLLEDWPARKKWSFAYLASICGEARVVVDSYNSARAVETSFAEFVQLLESSKPQPQAPVYLQEWYYRTSCPWLADDLPELAIAQYDFRRNLYGERISTNHQLWIGQRGATTRLHQDSYLIDVMHAQLVGSKHWLVLSPNASLGRREDGELDFCGMDNPQVQIKTAVLEPGDVLYLPARWWHRIELLSDSIGLGRKCLDEANLREHLRLRFAELMALALNHDEVKRTHPELYKVVIMRNRAWAKLMEIDLSQLRP